MKYLLQKSGEDPLWWVLTDTENQIVCKFKEGAFNETQKYTPLKDISEYDVTALPRIAKEIADWLSENHYEIVFTSPQFIGADARRDLGDQIREIRESLGYSVEHLSRLTGLSTNNIIRIEDGRYNLSVDTLALIANVMGRGIYLED